MSSHFKYLCSIIQKDEKINSDVNHRIQASLMKWGSATGVLCDCNITLWPKEKFYRTAIRLVLLYDIGCSVIKRYHVQKMSVAEMHIFRWMCSNIRRDKARNRDILTKICVARIEEKMRENRLRWFNHVQR